MSSKEFVYQVFQFIAKHPTGCFSFNQLVNFLQSGEMRITLLFVLAIATFVNCKKSEAKHDGYLIQKKGHKKSATYLKMKKSRRKLRAKFEPKEPGADFNDIDIMASWEKKEKHWMDKWDTEWEKIYSEAKIEKSKPKPEAGREMEGWDILMDALRDTNKAKIEVQKMRNQTCEYIRFFVNPKYKRSLKWVQTTTDTENIFLAHTTARYLQESIHHVKKKGKKEKRPCDATHSCSWTTHATTEASTTTAETPPPGTTTLWPPLIEDRKEREFVNSFLSRELEQLTWNPNKPSNKKKAMNSDYSEETATRLVCKPKNR